jgi:hypothetical protein
VNLTVAGTQVRPMLFSVNVMVPVAVSAVVNRPLTVLIVTLAAFPAEAAVVHLTFLTENVPLGETLIVPTSLLK